MAETKVFADRYTQDFSSATDFFEFLAQRKENSSWMKAPSKELTFQSVERDSPTGDLFSKLYNANGCGDLMEDTMENTNLLMMVNGQDYPVRSCAIKTILERARISGHALSKVSSEVFSQILNYCMGVAAGQSLIKIADAKVSAVHGGDAKDYAVLEMLPLFQAVSDFLNAEFPGNHFLTAHFDHTMATAVWMLDGQADALLDTYRRELITAGIRCSTVTPALRFMTSDVGMSGANLYPILLVGTSHRIVPLGYPIKTEHKSGADLTYFQGRLKLLYAKFREALEAHIRLMDTEIRYPANTILGVLKHIGAPKKASYEVQDEFLVACGDGPCTAYKLYLYMSGVIFSAQCEGASGARISQLEEIIARAVHVAWHDYDRPGDFKW